MDGSAFYPLHKQSVSIAATTSTANAALPTRDEEMAIRIENSSSSTIYTEFGKTSAVTATTGSTAILPGAIEIFRLPPEINYVAAVAVSSGTIYYTIGRGR